HVGDARGGRILCTGPSGHDSSRREIGGERRADGDYAACDRHRGGGDRAELWQRRDRHDRGWAFAAAGGITSGVVLSG
ncbi:hypothetical protein CEE82_12595, partial [Lactobacillus crispatus]